MYKMEVKFGDWLEKGFNLYKDNFLVLVLASLVSMVLSLFTIGILAGPMLSGMVIIVLALVDKQTPKPEVGDLFKGFSFFANSFLFLLVWGILSAVAAILLSFIPCVGTLASMFLSYSLQALLMFGLFLIVDKKMEFWAASMESINIVKTNFWPFLGFAIVCSIISSLGAIACGIGVILTAPIYYAAMAVAYRDVMAARAAGGPVIDVPATEVPPAPPPPPMTPPPPPAVPPVAG